MKREGERKEMKNPKLTEMGKGNGKGRKHPEAAVRMNFLHQAAACVLKSTGNKVKSHQMSLFIILIVKQLGFKCSPWQSHGCCWSEKSSATLQRDQENSLQGSQKQQSVAHLSQTSPCQRCLHDNILVTFVPRAATYF